MINARKQISDALLSIIDNVKMTQPEGDVELPLITYAEITNVNVGPREDRIEYQIDGYANTFEDCLRLTQEIDKVMAGMGWHRTYVTPDTQTRRAKDLYQKSGNYVARVDTELKNITGGY